MYLFALVVVVVARIVKVLRVAFLVSVVTSIVKVLCAALLLDVVTGIREWHVLADLITVRAIVRNLLADLLVIAAVVVSLVAILHLSTALVRLLRALLLYDVVRVRHALAATALPPARSVEHAPAVLVATTRVVMMSLAMMAVVSPVTTIVVSTVPSANLLVTSFGHFVVITRRLVAGVAKVRGYWLLLEHASRHGTKDIPKIGGIGISCWPNVPSLAHEFVVTLVGAALLRNLLVVALVLVTRFMHLLVIAFLFASVACLRLLNISALLLGALAVGVERKQRQWEKGILANEKQAGIDS